MGEVFISIQEWDYTHQDHGVLQQQVKEDYRTPACNNEHIAAVPPSPHTDIWGSCSASANYPLKSTQLREVYKPGSSEKVTTSLNCSWEKGVLF